MDYTTITSAISFTDVLTGVGVIGVAMVGLYVGIKGVKILFGALKSI